MDTSNMFNRQVENLLTQVTHFQKKYEEIATITGENFNIFKVLKMEAKEVRTHSAFLAELLNPKGSHGLGDVFLKLFIEVVRVNETSEKEHHYTPQFSLTDFQTTEAKVKVEFHTGPKSEETGGRIDILVSSGKNKLIIENKIHASDQDNQLVRYHHYDPNAPLFYLTLRANQLPADPSKGKLEEGQHYKRISYETEILNWLGSCREKAANHALLRETLTQYMNLIRHLTHKSLNNKMENELIEMVMKSEENFDAHLVLQGLNTRQIIINNKVGSQIVALANKHGLTLGHPSYMEANGRVFLFGAEWLASEKLRIGFSFYANGFDFGFAKVDFNKPLDVASIEKLKSLMTEFFPEHGKLNSTDHWPAWYYKEIDFELLLAIWEGRLILALHNLITKLLLIVNKYKEFNAQNHSIL